MTDTPVYSQPAAPLAAGSMPLLGFGTWQLSDADAEGATTTALESGYRHIDTATGYSNEAGIGRALASAFAGNGLSRDDVFVTTKLPPDNAGRERETIEESLRKLGLDSVDLWLIHWPTGGNDTEVWKRFIELRDEGLTRNIGVSNFSIEQIDGLIEATGEAPAVDQIPWAPSKYDRALADDLAQRKVVLEGYSPFKQSDLNDGTLTGIAEAHGVSATQVIVAWHAAHGFVVIPKSARRERIIDNAAGIHVELTDDEVGRIDALATS